MLENPLPHFETGFPPWEPLEPMSVHFDPISSREQDVFSLHPSQEPVSPNSGSDTSNPLPITPIFGSNEPNRKRPKNSSSGSDETGQVIDERKRRRMLSNRESARRSRMRKQKHLENMRNQMNRLKIVNRELMNRLRFVVHQNQLVRTENECLGSEAVVLRQRLWDIRQVLLVRQLQQHLTQSTWPCTNVVASIKPNQSLII
ncbi:hypothetical protein ACJIZ3_014970 [Penstemon smallii]|uniref:BZIP domain-containing protein n=1 Tax=Penstemon smallii TaxID=265156 RepID=A0ABD3RL59_9LAMI